MVGSSEQLLSASGSPAPWTEGGSPVIQGGDGEGEGEVTAVDSESTTTSAVRSKIKSKPKSKPRRGGRKKKLTEDEQLVSVTPCPTTRFFLVNLSSLPRTQGGAFAPGDCSGGHGVGRPRAISHAVFYYSELSRCLLQLQDLLCEVANRAPALSHPLETPAAERKERCKPRPSDTPKALGIRLQRPLCLLPLHCYPPHPLGPSGRCF